MATCIATCLALNAGAIAAVHAIEALRAGSWSVSALQDHHPSHNSSPTMEVTT